MIPNISNKPLSVEAIKEIEARGPWKTKSEGSLMVLCAILYNDIMSDFLRFDEEELANIPAEIRGLRVYSVRNLRAGSKGGMEFHRIRTEILFVLDGAFNLECEDAYGNKRNFRLDSHRGVYVPPFILHTYETIEDGGLLVIANTLFNPENPKTQDSYSQEEFRKLQEGYI